MKAGMKELVPLQRTLIGIALVLAGIIAIGIITTRNIEPTGIKYTQIVGINAKAPAKDKTVKVLSIKNLGYNFGK